MVCMCQGLTTQSIDNIYFIVSIWNVHKTGIAVFLKSALNIYFDIGIPSDEVFGTMIIFACLL